MAFSANFKNFARQKTKNTLEKAEKSAEEILRENMPSAIEPEGFFFLIWAIFLDILSLIPVLGSVVSIIGYLTIGLWAFSKMQGAPTGERFWFLFKKLWKEAVPIIGSWLWWSQFMFKYLKK